MAAVPKTLAETGRRSSSASRKAQLSHGRGGAGNISKTTAADLEPVNLETPTLKGHVYTTGRGGSGNMAKNDDPEAARRAQDVIGQPRRESGNNTHIGRGGAANVFKASQADVDAAKKDNTKWESAISDDKHDAHKTESKGVKGFADKGKEFLFGKKH